MSDKKIKEFIEKKSLLYKTKVEYGDYTINHVLGCSHGCNYPCYAMMLAKRFGQVKTYDEWIEPKLVKNAEELLKKELPKMKDKIKWVHFCFTTDPFMYEYPEVTELTLKLIKTINNSNIKCTALTKGILPLELKDYSKENEFGITLISLDEKYREKSEPNSAPYQERIESLLKLHENGIKTWVSIEPYPTPNILKQDFKEILKSIEFVDKIIFGRLNYNKDVTAYKKHKSYYNDLTKQVIEFCNEHNISFHIKEGTQTEE